MNNDIKFVLSITIKILKKCTIHRHSCIEFMNIIWKKQKFTRVFFYTIRYVIMYNNEKNVHKHKKSISIGDIYQYNIVSLFHTNIYYK